MRGPWCPASPPHRMSLAGRGVAGWRDRNQGLRVRLHRLLTGDRTRDLRPSPRHVREIRRSPPPSVSRLAACNVRGRTPGFVVARSALLYLSPTSGVPLASVKQPDRSCPGAPICGTAAVLYAPESSACLRGPCSYRPQPPASGAKSGRAGYPAHGFSLWEAADWPGPYPGHPSSEPGTAVGLITGCDPAIRGAPSTRARAGRSSVHGSRSGSSRARRRGSGRR